MYSQETLSRIREKSILEVADKLQLRYYGRTGRFRTCRCFLHTDKHPSMWLKTTNDTWHCAVCSKGGGTIALVMEHEKLSYGEALDWMVREFNIPCYDDRTPYRPLKSALRREKPSPRQPGASELRQSVQPLPAGALVRSPMEQPFRPSPFTTALVATRILTETQMMEAARRYRLGATRDGGVIFWMMDDRCRVLDGKIMFYLPDCHRDHSRHPSSVSSRLIRLGKLPADYCASRCLFGLHLLSGLPPEADTVVAVVESEKTAIICSQLMDGIWLATGGLSNLTPESLLPLKGRRIILFPDTDADGSTYRRWLRTAEEASRLLGHPVTVSDLLERIATPEQKQRKIDIADLFTSNN